MLDSTTPSTFSGNRAYHPKLQLFECRRHPRQHSSGVEVRQQARKNVDAYTACRKLAIGGCVGCCCVGVFGRQGLGLYELDGPIAGAIVESLGSRE